MQRVLFSTPLTSARRRAEVSWSLPGAKAGPKASPKMQSVLLPQNMVNKGLLKFVSSSCWQISLLGYITS